MKLNYEPFKAIVDKYAAKEIDREKFIDLWQWQQAVEKLFAKEKKG